VSLLLSLTETAAEAARQLAASSGLEPDPGLRITSGEPSPTGTALQIGLTGAPEASDQTVAEGGATVYVEDQVAEFLDDKVLDAELDGGQVRFRLQEAGGGV
jgi:iron-sulfur cluster assembly protein